MSMLFITYHVSRALRCLGLLCLWLCAFAVSAQDSRNLLILNSIDYTEQWVDDLTQTIILHAAAAPGIECRIVDFNSSCASDSVEFETFADDVVRNVAGSAPSYVVMIGNLAFNMCPAVRRAWGDVPILLVTRVKGVLPVSDFSGGSDQLLPLGEFRLNSRSGGNYNFTAIVVPSMYGPTVDMIHGLMPHLRELVFVTDGMPYNRLTADELSEYVQRRFPDMAFKWVSTYDAGAAEGCFEDRSGHTAVLVSTMGHSDRAPHIHLNARTNDLRLISFSQNPVFSLTSTGLGYGAVGGVFPLTDDINARAIEVLDSMFAGSDMRTIPIRTIDRCEPVVNYPALEKYHLDADECPDGTVFVGRTLSFVERYNWPLAVSLVVLVLGLVIIIVVMYFRRKDTRIHNRSIAFLRDMPVPYAATKIRFDADGNVVDFEYKMTNEAYDRIVEANRVEGSPSLIFPVDFILPKVQELLQTGETVSFPYHFPATDTYYTFILRLAVDSSFDLSPRAKIMDVFALDYTSLHHIEQKQRLLARRLDVTLESARRDPFSFDISAGKMVYDRYVRVGDTDTRRHEILDFRSRLELVHPDDHHLFTDLIYDRTPQDGTRFEFEYRRRRPDSDEYDEWIEVSGSIEEFDNFGRPRRIIGSLHDITKRKRREAQIAEALERAEESDAMKSSFLANMGHEFRTPLNALIGFSEVLSGASDSKERERFCEIINSNAHLLLDLINDVMDLAKIEANMVELSYARTDINALLRDIRDEFAGRVAKGVSLSFDPGVEMCVAQVDPVRLGQVLRQLVDNACKFTARGSIVLGYDILKSGTIYFYVKDTGRGISPDVIGKVFERFYKHDPFVPGTGLGLTICKKIVENMGGTIGVDSDGHGSTFWFTLEVEN